MRKNIRPGGTPEAKDLLAGMPMEVFIRPQKKASLHERSSALPRLAQVSCRQGKHTETSDVFSVWQNWQNRGVSRRLFKTTGSRMALRVLPSPQRQGKPKAGDVRSSDLDRWAKYTGRDPIREDGTPWSKIKANGTTP